MKRKSNYKAKHVGTGAGGRVQVTTSNKRAKADKAKRQTGAEALVGDWSELLCYTGLCFLCCYLVKMLFY